MSRRFLSILITAGIVTIVLSATPSFASPHVVFIQSTNTQVNSAFNSKAANLRLTLNNLLKEHTVMGAIMLGKLYEGKNTTQLESLMISNGDQITAIITKTYGTNVGNQFSKLWTEHMQEYKNYTIAEKNGNTTGMNTARANLYTIASQMGNLLGKASKNVSSQTITNLMTSHIDGTLAFVDAIASGNETTAANLMKQGYDQAGQFADGLTHAILLDKPQEYQ